MVDEDVSKKWGSGVLLAIVGVVWGVGSLVSGRLVIPFFRWKGIPLTSDIPIQGVSAILLSTGLIWFGLYLHFSDFSSCYPRATRFTRGAEVLSGRAATIFFTGGIIAWLVAR